MSNIVKVEFKGNEIEFNGDGWFDATIAAAKYGKRPVDWLKQKEVQEYIASLSEALGVSDSKSLIKTKKSSGTWLHPKLGVAFARWLDIDFGVWCDLQIDKIIRGEIDVKRLRHDAAATFKVMTAILKVSRDVMGKVTEKHHYSNEARLVNWALSGKFQSLNRDDMTGQDLDLLAKLEEKNAVLIGRDVEYNTRKSILEHYSLDMRQHKMLEAA